MPPQEKHRNVQETTSEAELFQYTELPHIQAVLLSDNGTETTSEAENDDSELETEVSVRCSADAQDTSHVIPATQDGDSESGWPS